MAFLYKAFIRKNSPELRAKLEDLGYKNGAWESPRFHYPYLSVWPNPKWGLFKGEGFYMTEDDYRFEGKVVQMSFAKACEELNTIWNNTSRFWEYDGKEYRTIKGVNLLEYLTMPPGHSWDDKWKDMQGEEHTTTWTWYLVMYQGKLYWTLRSQYYPQQEIVRFKGLDVEPRFEHGGQWTNAKNLHPVYVKNKNNEWEMV